MSSVGTHLNTLHDASGFVMATAAAAHQVERSSYASRSQRVAGRLGRLLVALAIAVGAIAAVAAPAGAAECWLAENGYAYVCSECRGTTVYATCFTLSRYTDGNIAVYIGIDIS